MVEDKKSKIEDYCFYLYEIKKKQFHSLKNGFCIGRTQGELIFEDDKLLSRRHLEFIIEGDQAAVKDLQTTNGISVNDQRATLHELNHNDVIKVGKQLFVFSLTNNVNDLKLHFQATSAYPVPKIQAESLDQNGEINTKMVKQERLVKLLIEGLKKPLDYKNINKIYYVIPVIIGAVHLLKLLFITRDTYYGPLTTEGHVFFNFLVGYYFAVVSIFFLLALFRQNQGRLSRLNQKIKVVMVAFITLFVFFLFQTISADFLETTVMENTNKLDKICRLKPEILKCSRLIHHILDDQKLLGDQYKFKIINAYFDHLILALKNHYGLKLTDEKQLSQLKLQAQEKLKGPRKKEFLEILKVVKKLTGEIVLSVEKRKKEIHCPPHAKLVVKRLYEEGDLLSIYCEYEDGLRSGPSLVFDHNNNLVSISNYENELLTGEQKVFYGSGQIKETSFFKQGVRLNQEVVTRWDPKGEITFQGTYEDKPTQYYTKGMKQILKNCEKEKSAMDISFENLEAQVEQCVLKTVNYQATRLHPEDEELLKKEAEIVLQEFKEKMAGKKTSFVDESERAFRCQPDGQMKRQDLTNHLVQIVCLDSDGRWNGPYGIFFENKRPKVKGYYINGISSGYFKHFYENGIIAMEGNFYNNKWIGEAIIRNQEGVITYRGDISKNMPDVKKMVQERVKYCEQIKGDKKTLETLKLAMKECLTFIVFEKMMKTHPAVTQLIKSEIDFELLKYGNRISINDLKCSPDHKLVKSETPNLLHVCVNKTDGTKDGPYILFYDNYVPKELGIFEKNIKSGPYRQYYENGKLAISSRYFQGQSIGVATRFDQNGKLRDTVAKEDLYQKKFVKLYEKIILGCKDPGQDICIENAINKYCDQNSKIDCIRLAEAQNYLNNKTQN